jgi:hypothetical protein
MLVKKDLLEGKFCWGDNQQTYIFKVNKNFFCPLTISNFKNQLVQELLKKLLSSIY